MTLTPTTIDALLERYDVFLLDAYGVLVDADGALPGASQLLQTLREREGKRFVVVSNDASRLPETTAARYRGFGLELRESEILTSGDLMQVHFARRGLRGVPCIVMGTRDSVRYVELAGGRVVPFDDETARVVVVADDDGYPFMKGIEQVITTVFHKLDRHEPVELVLPNPDMVYPKGNRAVGLASGSVAAVIESALRVRYPARAPTFVGLGKPYRPIFDKALEHTGASDLRRVVMFGDQLGTDIRGACDYGIDSVLLTTGLTNGGDVRDLTAPLPTWILDGLDGG